MANVQSPLPERRLLGRFNLKIQLLVAFCALAVGPALIAMAIQMQASQSYLVQAVHSVTGVGQDALVTSSRDIARTTLDTLSLTSGTLIGLSQKAITQNSDSLIHISRSKLQESNKQVISISQRAHEEAVHALTGQSRKAIEKVSSELVNLGVQGNKELAKTTATVTEQAVKANAEQLIKTQGRLGQEIAEYLEKANQEAAEDASRRLLKELETDPLVNFRLLAQIIAQTFAGGKVAGVSDAYLMDVTRHGQVRTSTRHKRGIYVRDLGIVERALTDSSEVAAQMPLIRYQDAGQDYLGVYTRKADGGAIIVSYSLLKAQKDMDNLGQAVKGSFDDLVTVTTNGTREAINATAPRIRSEAEALTRQTVETIHQESTRISQNLAQRMQQNAHATTQDQIQGMTAQARATAVEATRLMTDNSNRIIGRAEQQMLPIGQRSVETALGTMRPEAKRAVDRIEAQLPPQIERARRSAEERMEPEAKKALDSSYAASLTIGILVLVVAVLMGILVSVMLSRRIADPIEVEKKLKEAELARFGKEMEIATRIQTALVPTDLDIQDFDLAMALETATEVGGDMIDYLPQEDGQFWLAIGDVTGHGLTPGLIMMMAQSILTGLVAEDPHASPRDLIGRLNRSLHNNVKYRLRNDNYMTLQLVRHEGDGCFVSAGMHCDYLIYRAAEHRVEKYETPGFWTGLVPDVSEMMEEYRFDLAPHDILLLYTDGLIEAMNSEGEQFDMDRLEAALLRHADEPVEAIQAKLLEEVKVWCPELKDDVSIIVLKRHDVPVSERKLAVV